MILRHLMTTRRSSVIVTDVSEQLLSWESKKLCGPCGRTRYAAIATFLPRDAMHPRSVCPSQVGVLLKRLNVGSHKQHHTIAQGL